MADVWTIQKVLAWATDDLRSRGSSSPRLDAELLLAHVLGTDRIALVVDSGRPLGKGELAAYRELHTRRRVGEPIAYLRGVREFYGRPFRVDRRVLVPRPETEILVEVAMARSQAWSMSARVLDLCTGSGCVAITLAKERPTTRVLGADISEDALAVARDNAVRLGGFNAAFVCSDLFASIAPDAKFEVITANPPYIAEAEIATLMPDIRDFEPRIALSGGGDGLEVIRRIVADAPGRLVAGGVLAMEVGDGQAEAVAALLTGGGFKEVERKRDYAGSERIVSGSAP